jgi:hypothetical protein
MIQNQVVFIKSFFDCATVSRGKKNDQTYKPELTRHQDPILYIAINSNGCDSKCEWIMLAALNES